MDLDIDISPEAYFRTPRPAKVKPKTGYEMFDETYRWLVTEIRKSRTDPDPLIGAKALVQARDTFDLLARNGYPSFSPLLDEMQKGIEALARLFRRETVRRILTPGIMDNEEAAKCLRVLSEIVERGEWPTAEQDCDEVEAQVVEAAQRA